MFGCFKLQAIVGFEVGDSVGRDDGLKVGDSVGKGVGFGVSC